MTDLITRAVLERAVLDRLATIHADTKRNVDVFLAVTERVFGKVDGQPVGVVQKKRGAQSARVTDPDALLAYAMEHRPDEVEEVVTYRVRPATEVAWLAAAKAGKSFTSETTGEVVDSLPGVTVSTAAPTLSIVPEKTPEVESLVDMILVVAGLKEIEAVPS